MGGSKSKSSQSSTQQQITTSTQVSAADQGTVAYGGTALGTGSTQLQRDSTLVTGGAAVTTGKNSNVTIQTLDAQVVADALGVTGDMASRLLDFAGDYSQGAANLIESTTLESMAGQREAVRESLDFGREALGAVSDSQREALDFGRDAGAAAFGFGADALDFGREALNSVSGAQQDAMDFAENTNVTLAKSLETFGTELSSVTERTTLAAQTGGASELTKGLTTGAIIAGVLGAIYLFKR